MAPRTTNGYALGESLRQRLTSRMKPEYLVTAFKNSGAFMFAATKLIYGPLIVSQRGASLAQHLFYNDYLNAIAPFGGENSTRSSSIIWLRRRVLHSRGRVRRLVA